MKKIIFYLTLLLSLNNSIANAVSVIYYSPSLNTTYGSIKKKSLEDALALAKSACNKEANDCELFAYSKKNGYAAIARNSKGGLVVRFDKPTLKKATEAALLSCNQSYGNCQITASFFDPIQPPYTPGLSH
jgi:hypothetical protein